jgi:hypothetical protein
MSKLNQEPHCNAEAERQKGPRNDIQALLAELGLPHNDNALMKLRLVLGAYCDLLRIHRTDSGKIFRKADHRKGLLSIKAKADKFLGELSSLDAHMRRSLRVAAVDPDSVFEVVQQLSHACGKASSWGRRDPGGNIKNKPLRALVEMLAGWFFNTTSRRPTIVTDRGTGEYSGRFFDLLQVLLQAGLLEDGLTSAALGACAKAVLYPRKSPSRSSRQG